jgi:hypothetical protein
MKMLASTVSTAEKHTVKMVEPEYMVLAEVIKVRPETIKCVCKKERAVVMTMGSNRATFLIFRAYVS